MSDPQRLGPERTARGVAGLIVALAVAVTLSVGVDELARAGALRGNPQTLIADACIWVPLLAGVWWSVQDSGGAVSAVGARLGMSFAATDVFWGVAAGLAVRAFDAVLRLGLSGSTGLSPGLVVGGGPSLATAVLLVVGAGVVSPVVEELFFRGALQRGLAAMLDVGAAGASGRPIAGRVVAVVLTALVFSLAHVLLAGASGGGATTAATTATAATTFVLGLVLGGITAATGRLGGALIGHVVFNGVALALTWPR